jgi:hypothetical protein
MLVVNHGERARGWGRDFLVGHREDYKRRWKSLPRHSVLDTATSQTSRRNASFTTKVSCLFFKSFFFFFLITYKFINCVPHLIKASILSSDFFFVCIFFYFHFQKNCFLGKIITLKFLCCCFLFQRFRKAA